MPYVPLGGGVQSFEVVNDVDREDGKHHHSQTGKNDGENFADTCHRKDVGSDRGDIHPSPPEAISEIRDLGVDTFLK